MTSTYYICIVMVLYLYSCNAQPIVSVRGDVFVGVGLSSSIICMILSILIVMVHINGYRKSKKSHKKIHEISKKVSIAFAIFSGLVHLCWFLDIVAPFNSMLLYCEVRAYLTGPNLYTIFKGAQSMVLVLRLYEVYACHNSAIGYGKKKLIVWGIFLLLWTIFTFIICCLTTTVQFMDETPKCHLMIDIPFIGRLQSIY